MKSMSLTELSCVIDVPFRTALSWTNRHPLQIKPSVKLRGVSKKQFSPAEVAQFLIAKHLFGQKVPSKPIQGFLDFLTEYEVLDGVFPSPEIACLQSPTRAELLAESLDGTFLLTWYLGDKSVVTPTGTVRPQQAIVIFFREDENKRFSDHSRPDFIVSDESVQLLKDKLNELGLVVSADSLRIAHDALVKENKYSVSH